MPQRRLASVVLAAAKIRLIFAGRTILSSIDEGASLTCADTRLINGWILAFARTTPNGVGLAPLRAFLFIACLLLNGCTSLAGQRLARSSYGCMEAVVRDRVPADLPDKHRHCVAAGLIARYCSVSEAYLAGSGKELSDLLGSGDASWADWQADRAGVRCARTSDTDADVAICCADKGF